MENEFDHCIDDKACVYKTVISGGLIYEEPCDIDNKQGSTNNYVSIKDETIDDLTVAVQESELINNCAEDMVCVNETVSSGEYIQEEPCNMKPEHKSRQNYANIKDENLDNLIVISQETQVVTNCAGDKVCINNIISGGGYTKPELCSTKDNQENVHNYVAIKQENIDDLTVVAQQTKFMTDCIDDKVWVNETVISGGYIKQEPCDTQDESQSICNYINIEDKNTNDFMFTVLQETELMANPKVNYFICCKGCGEEYDLYCLKCPMLFRILDSNNPDEKYNTVRWTLPKHFIDICETASGVGIVALRTIPKGVVFGPFKGLVSTKDDAVSKWKLRNKKLAYAKDPEWLNWMQYIRSADQNSHQNLQPFQYEDGLYYRSDCHISVGDELLVCWDSDGKESTIQDMEDGYWKPPICESLDDSYACTLCCVGYKSINHLIAHNCVCSEKRNKKDFCKEIVQCDICKIYLDKKEYTDCHMDLCNNRNTECGFKMCYKSSSGRSLFYHVDIKQINCESGDIGFGNTRLIASHKEVHALGAKTCSCCKYKYRTGFQYAFSKHLVRVYDGTKLKRYIAHQGADRPFACTLCPYKATTKPNLRKHIPIHNHDKQFACTLCSYKATTNSRFKRHIAIHNGDKPFACTVCPYKATTNSRLKVHSVIHNGDKPFACTLCSYKATTNWSLKQHYVTHTNDRPFACTVCSYKATTNSKLKRHVSIHNGDKSFACTLCAYRTGDNSTLKRHIAIHNGDKQFACTLCPYKAITKWMLKQHISVHNDDRPLECTLCPYKAKRKTDLKQHIAIHNGDKPFVCTLCPYKATTSSNLKQHIVTHKDDRPFACSLCPYKSSTKSNLKKHIAIHNGDKPYPCTLCPYKARTNAIMKQHIAIHDGDKPFACTLCSYKVTTNWKLKQHLVTHNEDRPFACTLCPRKATTESSLKRHIANHNSERSFACTLCPYKAKTKSILKKHIAIHNVVAK